MITLDKEAQTLAEKREMDIVIPFECRAERPDSVNITAFPVLRRFAEEYEAKYRGDYFSSDAIREIREVAMAVVSGYGYEECVESRKYYHEFLLLELSDLVRERLRDDSTVLTREPKKNQTTFDIRALLRYGHRIAATIIDGTVVSVAATHEPESDGDMIEIGVETAPAYRGQGFALSNTVLLSEMLLKDGKGVLYCCSNENLSSQHIARASGFAEIAKRYYYVGRRK